MVKTHNEVVYDAISAALERGRDPQNVVPDIANRFHMGKVVFLPEFNEQRNNRRARRELEDSLKARGMERGAVIVYSDGSLFYDIRIKEDGKLESALPIFPKKSCLVNCLNGIIGNHASYTFIKDLKLSSYPMGSVWIPRPLDMPYRLFERLLNNRDGQDHQMSSESYQ